jgi:hypothetical protein
VAQDALMMLGKALSGLKPVLYQPGAVITVGPKGIGLSAGPVQRRHLTLDNLLVERVLL